LSSIFHGKTRHPSTFMRGGLHKRVREPGRNRGGGDGAKRTACSVYRNASREETKTPGSNLVSAEAILF